MKLEILKLKGTNLHLLPDGQSPDGFPRYRGGSECEIQNSVNQFYKKIPRNDSYSDFVVNYDGCEKLLFDTKKDTLALLLDLSDLNFNYSNNNKWVILKAQGLDEREYIATMKDTDFICAIPELIKDLTAFRKYGLMVKGSAVGLVLLEE